MKIFVANTTKQDMELNYSIPKERHSETGRLLWSGVAYTEAIAAGQQACLGGGREFTAFEAAELFEHHAQTFGAVKAGQQVRGFVGQLWSDKEIDVEDILESIKLTEEAAGVRADKMLDLTAAGSLDREQRKAAGKETPQPQSVSLEVIPEGSKDGRDLPQPKGAEAVASGVEPTNRAGRTSKV